MNCVCIEVRGDKLIEVKSSLLFFRFGSLDSSIIYFSYYYALFRKALSLPNCSTWATEESNERVDGEVQEQNEKKTHSAICVIERERAKERGEGEKRSMCGNKCSSAWDSMLT